MEASSTLGLPSHHYQSKIISACSTAFSAKCFHLAAGSLRWVVSLHIQHRLNCYGQESLSHVKKEGAMIPPFPPKDVRVLSLQHGGLSTTPTKPTHASYERDFCKWEKGFGKTMVSFYL